MQFQPRLPIYWPQLQALREAKVSHIEKATLACTKGFVHSYVADVYKAT